MSYTIAIQCGCIVYVSCHPRTRVAHTRVIESRGAVCSNRRHHPGERLWLWEMLPDGAHPAAPRFQERAKTTLPSSLLINADTARRSGARPRVPHTRSERAAEVRS
jgi:hypothetical protein